jgi:hypothetical protein
LHKEGDIMYRPNEITRRPGPGASLAALALLTLMMTCGPAAHGESDPPPQSDLSALLGIPIYPGSELITLEGPSIELVDLQRPGWEFCTAEILVADFLVSDPIADLRRFYRELCIRDPLLLLVMSDRPDNEIVALRYAARHPLHPKKRWLRIVTYRQSSAGTAQRDGT